MRSFKEWLLKEDIANDLAADGDLMHPTNAGDAMYAFSEPVEFSWLQWKWGQERKQGRKFINIDIDEFDKKGFIAIQSNDMPDTSPGFWQHKESDTPSTTPHKHFDVIIRGVAKNSKETVTIPNKGLVKVVLPLDKMFNDKPSGKWPEAAVDKSWY